MSGLNIAVVGHTNTGKTSLMRTLLRDSQFGEVKNAASTTRHVEEALIGETVRLYDTPGLEDAGGMLDWLESETSTKNDGIERLNSLLNSPAAQTEFSQEAKVLRQLFNSDCALYVIDAREPVLPKYKDELTILSWCAKPIMPVFNFTAGRDLSEWQTMLARRNMHIFSSFDTVAFDFDGEMRLWTHLATMLPERNQLEQLMAHRRAEWQHLDKRARLHIAHFLLNIAAYRQSYNDEQEDIIKQKQNDMHNQVRQAEQSLHTQLLNLYHFYHSQLHSETLPIQALRQDPFDSELLLHYGIRTSKGVATGAAVGLGFDVLTAGLSLGLGTAVGSLLGGLLPNWQTLSDKLTGTQTLLIDDHTLMILATRALAVLHTLQSRGHAAIDEVHLPTPSALWQKQTAELQQARHEPNWSSFNHGISEQTATHQREQAAQQLAKQLV